jgi:hypothetical protein
MADNPMTPHEINAIVSRMTAQGFSQTEIKDHIAIMQGRMAPKSEKAPPPSDDDPPRAA